MTATRKKKNKKQRGYTTHGYGSRKKHRGAGNRGGKGNAGAGKRAGHKKSKYPKDHLGKRGFKSLYKAKKTINVGELEKLEKGIKREKDHVIVNLKELGVKLLGKGKVRGKFKVEGEVSKEAAEKIKKAGGELISEENVD